TAAIRIDRAIKTDIRRAIARDDRTRTLDHQIGFKQMGVLFDIPAIGFAYPLMPFEPAIGAGIRATGLQAFIWITRRQNGIVIEQNRNKIQQNVPRSRPQIYRFPSNRPNRGGPFAHRWQPGLLRGWTSSTGSGVFACRSGSAP